MLSNPSTAIVEHVAIVRSIPRVCFDGTDPVLRVAAFRAYEREMWADAVEFRRLRISMLDPIDAIAVSELIRQRNRNR